MADKFVAKGTLIQVGDGAEPEVFVNIPNVADIEGPGGETSEIDVTDHDSPGSFDEFLPGTADPGSADFPIHYDPADAIHTQLFEDQASQTVRNYRKVYTTANDETFAFPAYVRQFRRSAAVKGALIVNVGLRITGAIEEVTP